MNRLLPRLILLSLLAVASGCPPTTPPAEPVVGTPTSATRLPAEPQLRQRLDASLTAGLFDRQLSTQRNGAWQILHGVLAYGEDCLVETPQGMTAVVPYLLDGGVVEGFEPLPADHFENPESQGLRVELEPGSKTGQGHRDQWLAILAQCDLPADQPLRVGGETFTVLDLVRQTEWDIPRNLEREYSWTLIGLTAYRPTDYRWTARDGQRWSIEGLVASELERDLATSACGGTHRLIGLAMTLRRHLDQGGNREGIWATVQQRIEQSIEMAKTFQNADGSFSSAYIHRPGWTPDLSEMLGTSGHTLELIAMAADDETLAAEWVERAVLRLCDVLALTEEIDLECGVLYHALHGLNVYHERRFGPWQAEK